MLKLANGLTPLGHFELLRNISLKTVSHSDGRSVALRNKFECLAESSEMPSRARAAGAEANSKIPSSCCARFKPAGASSPYHRRQRTSKRKVMEDVSDGLGEISELPGVSSNLHESINFVLNAEPTHFSPLDAIFAASDVENGLENFFRLESIGIKEDMLNYDKECVAKVKESIKFDEGVYYVDLPWRSNIMD